MPDGLLLAGALYHLQGFLPGRDELPPDPADIGFQRLLHGRLSPVRDPPLRRKPDRQTGGKRFRRSRRSLRKINTFPLGENAHSLLRRLPRAAGCQSPPATLRGSGGQGPPEAFVQGTVRCRGRSLPPL